jgi:glycosyltransferase involved in cell wall biosynthesis
VSQYQVKHGAVPAFSLVISTRGRTRELSRLFESLSRQSLRDFEVVIVDQNEDDRLSEVLSDPCWTFPIAHIRTPGQRGLSRGRNVGWRSARGRIVAFPDDDCWYAPWVLVKAHELLESTGAGIVAGRAADESGRSINGRFETTSQRITRDNVWTTSIEWVVFFRREVLEAINGYDDNIGIGADAPWQASEGHDIVLRALDEGVSCYFDPSLYGFHAELNVAEPDAAMLAKARAYGRGMGYVLRRNEFRVTDAIYWIGRPSAAAVMYAVLGKRSRSRYYLNVAKGRFEGWCKWV